MSTSEQKIKAFDTALELLYGQLVEIAFEFVGRNKEEIDKVYVYCLMESGQYFYNVHYKINGHFTKPFNANQVSRMQYEITRERIFALLKQGAELLQQVAQLFISAGRQVPTVMKIIYEPGSAKFTNEFGYNLQYTNHKEKTAANAFEEWVAEIRTLETN